MILIFLFIDNIDTRSALEALRDLVTSSNIYMKERKPLDTLLLVDISLYITKMLSIFGTMPESLKIGFPISSGTDSDNVSNFVVNPSNRNTSL